MDLTFRMVKRAGQWYPELPDAYTAVSLFLLDDVQGDGSVWLQRIDTVLEGKAASEELTGNTTTVTIGPEESRLFHNLMLEPTHCTISTRLLRKLIVEWVSAPRNQES